MLSVIVRPEVPSVVALNVVKVPAKGVAHPIIVLSIAPPFISMSLDATFPVPDPDNSKFEFDVVVFNTLSERFILESIVKFVKSTLPVPTVPNTMSALLNVDFILFPSNAIWD